jgi:transposase-like protein
MEAEDYPRTLQEFEERFSTEESCRDYLFHLRWPGDFTCPRCGAQRGWHGTRGRMICGACRYHASVTAGTVFADTRKPLRLWFRAMWYVTSQKAGGSAIGLQRVLGLGSYPTAWTWLHKLRRAMVRPGRDRLCGEVEVDETFVGGTEEAVHGRETEKKALVVIAVEKRGKHGFGRVRMARIPDASSDSLLRFMVPSIEPGSLVCTDGWLGYSGVKAQGYRHKVTVLSGRGKDAALRELPRVHRIAGLIKRWLQGTHQGRVAPAHLDYYLDEYTFRFNRRTSASRGKLFYRLIQQAVQTQPVPYHRIVGGTAALPPQPQCVGVGGVN